MTSPWLQLQTLGLEVAKAGTVAVRQEHWLLECLSRNSGCDYGQRHTFDQIHGIADFRKRVPLISYEDIAGDIRRMYEGETEVLFSGSPLAFERTGGSICGSKLIPYSRHSLLDFQAAVLPWLAAIITQSGITHGSGYFSISPATRQPEITPGGLPVGLSDGAYLGNAALKHFAAISSVPAWAGSMQDVSLWQLTTLYFLLSREDLVLISIWSPTFFLTLLDALERRLDELEMLLTHGGGAAGRDLPGNPQALLRLRQFRRDGNTAALWPGLKLISCWSDGSSRPFFDQLRKRIPHAAFQGKGLLSTEGVISVPNAAGQPVLAADSGFFEFMDDQGDIHLAQELVPGNHYETIMTTSGGLYRYRTGDRVLVEGFADKVPAFRFLGRRGVTSDMVGEKLSEDFVSACLKDVPGFRLLVPVIDPQPRYALVVDELDHHEPTPLIERVEARLAENPQYAQARSLGQLERLALHSASCPLEAYVDRFLSSGARLGDVKVTALRPETDWLNTFSGTVS